MAACADFQQAAAVGLGLGRAFKRCTGVTPQQFSALLSG
jgi:hypothetical protein